MCICDVCMVYVVCVQYVVCMYLVGVWYMYVWCMWCVCDVCSVCGVWVVVCGVWRVDVCGVLCMCVVIVCGWCVFVVVCSVFCVCGVRGRACVDVWVVRVVLVCVSVCWWRMGRKRLSRWESPSLWPRQRSSTSVSRAGFFARIACPL